MIKLYVSDHCEPCQLVKELVDTGKIASSEEVKLINIETDEGFEQFFDDVLVFDDGAVPSAYKDKKRCEIIIDDDRNLTFKCPSDEAPLSETT